MILLNGNLSRIDGVNSVCINAKLGLLLTDGGFLFVLVLFVVIVRKSWLFLVKQGKMFDR